MEKELDSKLDPDLSKSKSPSRSCTLVFLLAVLALLCGFVYDLQAPFYPIEAQSKGVSVTWIGFVYGIYELTSFFVSPFAGAALTRIGPVTGLHWGILLTGLSTIGLGLISYLVDRTLFIFLSVLLRILQSIGASLRAISILSMATFAFPKKVATTMASVECIAAIGGCLGGVAGGGLMQVSGFMTTFTLAGAVLLCTLPPSMLVLRSVRRSAVKKPAPALMPMPDVISEEFRPMRANSNVNSNQNHNPITIGLWTLLRSPSIAVSVFSLVSAAVSHGAVMVVMEPNLKQFNLTPLQIGLVFLCPLVTYMTSSPLLGYLYDKLKARPGRGDGALFAVQYVAPLLMAGGVILVGPVRFAPFEPSMPLVAVGLALLGTAAGSSSVSSFLIAVESGKKLGSKSAADELRVHELISGIWRGAISLGLFAGPTLSGFLYDLIGFQNECLLIFGLQIFHVFLIAFYGCIRKDS